MEWMYNEQPKDEKPSSDMNDQASICDSENNLGDKGSSEIGQIEGMVSHDDDGKGNAQATPFVHDQDGSEQTNRDASAVASPVTSDFDEFTTRVIDPKQPGDEEDVRESVSNSNEKVPCEGDSLDKATSINGGVTNDDLGNMAEEDFEDITDKDKMIHLLQKEVKYYMLSILYSFRCIVYISYRTNICFFQVNSLRVKIAELESQCGDGDSSRKLHQGNC